jgi:hypothetical protein
MHLRTDDLLRIFSRTRQTFGAGHFRLRWSVARIVLCDPLRGLCDVRVHRRCFTVAHGSTSGAIVTRLSNFRRRKLAIYRRLRYYSRDASPTRSSQATGAKNGTETSSSSARSGFAPAVPRRSGWPERGDSAEAASDGTGCARGQDGIKAGEQLSATLPGATPAKNESRSDAS